MKNYSDEELVKGYQQGEEACFNELYRRYHKRLEFTAYRLCNKNREDARDAVQQTFIQVQQAIGTLRDAKLFYNWCNRILFGKCTDLFRKNRDVLMDIANSPLATEYVEQRRDYHPYKFFHFQNDKEVLLDIIDRLPYTQKQVIMLVYFDQQSMKECAAILGLPEGTVKSRLHSAKASMKEMILRYNQLHPHSPLDFHNSLTPIVIGAALQAAYKKAFLPALSIKYWNLPPSLITGSLLASVAGIGVGGAFYMSLQQASSELRTNAFTPVDFQGHTIKNEKEAYFALRNWAVDERQMADRSAEEIAYASTLYTQIKDKGGAYWDVLVKDEWNLAFEKLQ